MKKTDINQLISAYYDNELTEGELDYLLEATKKDPELLSKLKNYGLISVISEKDDKVVSIFTNISDFVQKRWVGNGLTAAATVLLTVMIINNPFDSRFSESEFINSQIRDAIESEEAAKTFSMIEKDLIPHVMSVIDSNGKLYGDDLAIDLSPVGFNRLDNNPGHFVKGKRKIQVRVEPNRIGINENKYWKSGNKLIYLYPTADGRIISIYGDLSIQEVEKIIPVLIK
jgi:hypothetical protein|tara:strand:+ start:455 stop:1138 length:684 start_codon:yes stop_codon:yes gene_type:complete